MEWNDYGTSIISDFQVWAGLVLVGHALWAFIKCYLNL